MTHNEMPKDTVEEKSKQEEWGAWKFVSEMLDNPEPYGIYHTSKCYEQIYDFVMEQKATAYNKGVEVGKVEERERIGISILNQLEAHTKIKALKSISESFRNMVVKALTPLPDDKL